VLQLLGLISYLTDTSIRIVRDLKATGDRNQIRRIIDLLTQEFAYSVQHNSRNGGLIGLAATTIALGQVEVAGFLKDLMPPVLACLGDQDARVRYYACESVYNICKVARGQCLLYFNELFDALSKLAADPEISVKNGADLLDRLIKDIVGEEAHQATDQIIITSVSHRLDGVASAEQQTTSVDLVAHNLDLPITGCFSLSKFIPLLAERIYTVNPFTRSFLISWITVLDSIPELELITYLPDFLDGLIGFVSDPNDDVRMGARYCILFNPLFNYVYCFKGRFSANFCMRSVMSSALCLAR
jgi:vacuole morphology and inheritance protein 14